MKRRSFFRALVAVLAAPKILAAFERLPSLSMVPCAAVEDPFEAFRLATEELPEEIILYTSSRSVWMDMVVRGTLPE